MQCANWNTWGPVADSAKKVPKSNHTAPNPRANPPSPVQVFCLTDADIASLARCQDHPDPPPLKGMTPSKLKW